MSEAYEPHLIDTITKLLQPGDICIDAGAHTGEFTATMAATAGHVHAFEILPANVEILRDLFSTNPFVTINRTALSDEIGIFDLYQGQSSFEANILGYDMRGNNHLNRIGSIETTTIDAYMADQTRLNLVKMDVEGAEHLVLKGMANTLRTLRPFVVIEFHDEVGWNGRHFLKDADYRLWAIYHKGQTIHDWVSYSHDRIYHCLGVPAEKAILLEIDRNLCA